MNDIRRISCCIARNRGYRKSGQCVRGERPSHFARTTEGKRANWFLAGSKLLFGLACLIALFISSSATIDAQVTTGTAVGAITETSGGAVVGARVELTNTDTGDKHSDISSGSGSYQFVNLQPGNYVLDVQASGFKHFTQTKIVVQVGSSTRVDAVLQVGDVTQSVEVTTQAALLETQQATVGQVVEGRSVVEMPLNGRDVLDMVALAPGVVPMQNVQQSYAVMQMMGINDTGDFAVSGGMANAGSEFLDGGIMNNGSHDQMSFVPSQDAIQEFKVEANNISPEYGGTENGIVSVVTKSGTNQFHGSAYEFLRNTVLDANTFFGNQASLPRAPIIQNQYGATAGGPIKKDKLFFFASWEGIQTTTSTTSTYTVPTTAERNALTTGNLSSISTAITDPGSFDPTYTTFTPYTSANCPPYDTATKTGTCVFTGNQIPTSRIDPTSVAMLAWWAAPLTTASTNNFTATGVSHPSLNQYIGRGDWNISDKQRTFARFLYQHVWNNAVPPYGNLPNITDDHIYALQAVLGDDYTFNPTTILNVRLAYLRFVGDHVSACIPNCNISSLGWPAALLSQMTPTIGVGIPSVAVTGLSGNGGGSTINPEVEENDAISGSITKILGRHTLKFGGEFRRMPNAQSTASNVETFSFTTAFTGNPWASYVLGVPFTSKEGLNITPDAVAYYAGLYINDDFQLNKRLSINAGGRWDYPGYWTERHDRENAFLPNAVDTVAAATGYAPRGDVALVNTPALPGRTNLNPHWDLFSPRIGLAYQLSSKNVVRAGYGIVWAQIAAFQGAAEPNSSPINSTVTIVQPTTTPVNAFHNPFPNGLVQPVQRSANYDQAVILGQSVDVPIPNVPSTYIEGWNADFEHDFGHQIVMDVAYVGAKGLHLLADSDIGLNELPSQYYSQGAALTASVTNPFYGLVPATSSMGGKTISAGQLLRPYPQYFNLQNPANSRYFTFYNGLQAKVQERLGEGGNLLVSYTFASDNGNADGNDSTGSGVSTPGVFQDYDNPQGEVSRLAFFTPQILVVSYVVDLPFGKGKRFLSQGGLADKVVGGWGFDGITTFHSGYPISINQTATTLSSSFGAGTPRPNVTPGCNTKNTAGSPASRITQWFNTSCFTPTGNFAFGNEPRVDPVLRGENANNWDISMFKGTEIGERINVQFRAEAFNTFNRVQFSNPSGTCCAATTFGVVSSQLNLPRQLQVALKVIF